MKICEEVMKYYLNKKKQLDSHEPEIKQQLPVNVRNWIPPKAKTQ